MDDFFKRLFSDEAKSPQDEGEPSFALKDFRKWLTEQRRRRRDELREQFKDRRPD